MRYSGDVLNLPPVVDVALLDCRVGRSSSDPGDVFRDFDLLDAEFFDDESIVLVYRCQKRDGALISYLRLHALIAIRLSSTNVYSNVRLQRFRVSNIVT